MLKASLFILICFVFFGWNGTGTVLFGKEYGKHKRIAGRFISEKHSGFNRFSSEFSSSVSESGFSDLSYQTSSPEYSQTVSPVVYYQGYYDSSPSYGESWSSEPWAHYQGYYDSSQPVYGENIDTRYIDVQNQEYGGYYSYSEPGILPEQETFYYPDYYAVDHSALYNGEEGGYQDRLTYKTFSPDANPFVKEIQLGWLDVQNFYTCDNAGNYGVLLGLMAIAANTSLDQRFIDWYQDNVRSSATDDVSSFWKIFGDGQYFYPIFIGGAVLGDFLTSSLAEDSCWNQSPVGEYFSRTARAEVIAVPVLLLGKAALGAARPSDGEGSSHWSHPFTKGYTSGISGHAYVGSIPFITLAQMSDSYFCKGLFYFGSTLTGLSRINDNCHYLSQVILGWYLGYLSCRAVTETETGPLSCGLTIFPLVSEESTQVGFSYSY